MEEDYETPAVEERTEVSAPLNTTKSSSFNPPAPPPTPTWRRPEAD